MDPDGKQSILRSFRGRLKLQSQAQHRSWGGDDSDVHPIFLG